MYCPKCFNNNLSICSHGVIHLIVNGKQMDAGRFLYNLKKEDLPEIQKSFHLKLEEFFEWYSNFKNKQAITKIEVCSGDFVCENGCHIDINSRFSVIDVLISKKSIINFLNDLGIKYKLHIELKQD